MTGWERGAAWEERFEAFLRPRLRPADPAHDLGHVRRVVASAEALARATGAALDVVMPAAWLHDCVVVPKSSPRRSRASSEAAEVAGAFLTEIGYPPAPVPAIRHAIAAHSFSAGIVPETLEAKVVQDADRLDALGAIGIARCLIVGGTLGRALYDAEEPFPGDRAPDDARYLLDHFFVKLLRLPETLQTAAGRAEAERRAAFMRQYLQQLALEIRTAPAWTPPVSSATSPR